MYSCKSHVRILAKEPELLKTIGNTPRKFESGGALTLKLLRYYRWDVSPVPIGVEIQIPKGEMYFWANDASARTILSLLDSTPPATTLCCTRSIPGVRS